MSEHPQSGGGFERTPPHDPMAEQCVLGGMLLSKEAISQVVEIVRSSDFYVPAHQVIFDTVIDLFSRGEPVDAISVNAELTKRGEIARIGGTPYLHTLTDAVPTAANAGYYARIVTERAVLRRLVEVGTRIAQLGYAGDGEVDQLVDQAQAEVMRVSDKRTSEDYLPLSEIMPGALDEIEAISSHDGGMVGVPSGFADFDALANGLQAGQMVIIAARPAMGKALALNTALPTRDGWTTMAEVQVGDVLIAPDGTPTRVVAATETMTGRPCYEITFDDGTKVVADAQHQWPTGTRSAFPLAQAAEGCRDRSRGRQPSSEIRTTEEIARSLHGSAAGRPPEYRVDNTEPLLLPERELPVPAYFLGAWLGAGQADACRISGVDPETLVNIEAEGLVTKPVDEGRSVHGVFLATDSADAARREVGAGGVEGRPRLPVVPPRDRSHEGKGRCQTRPPEHETLQARLRALAVLGNKHIPCEYLRSSVKQRRDLLAGLLDTVATVDAGGRVRFPVTRRRLAEDFRELLHSLGYRSEMKVRKVRGAAAPTCHVVTFRTADFVFGTSLKRQVHERRSVARRLPRRRSRFITQVRPVDSVPVRCVQVDHPQHMYLATPAMIPTHNSTLALDFARAASIHHQLSSVLFSLEMGRNEIVMRLLSAEARVPLHTMRSGLMTDDDWTRLARRMGEVAGAPLFIDDSPNMSMMEIRAKCRRLKQQHDLKLVIVDYLQLMSSTGRVESRQQEVSEMSRSLKLLAKELDVPVIALSQLNRGPEQRTDKKPQLSDLRESGSIEQDADMVILLHREDAYEKESPRAGEADMIVAKHRNGPTATVTVAFQGHYSRFVDMAPG